MSTNWKHSNWILSVFTISVFVFSREIFWVFTKRVFFCLFSGSSAWNFPGEIGLRHTTVGIQLSTRFTSSTDFVECCRCYGSIFFCWKDAKILHNFFKMFKTSCYKILNCKKPLKCFKFVDFPFYKFQNFSTVFHISKIWKHFLTVFLQFKQVSTVIFCHPATLHTFKSRHKAGQLVSSAHNYRQPQPTTVISW